MKSQFLRAASVAILAAAFLSGCVSMPKQQAFNHEAHRNLKSIAVLETMPTHTSVFMLNNPGMSFGLIGGLIAAADQANKEKKFHDIQTQAGFDPLAYFKDRLTAHMGERGYALVWPQAQVETKKVPRAAAFGLRKSYQPVAPGSDAQLDVNFGFVGFAAAGAGKGAPYRPTVTLAARLVSADGRENFYTDYFAYNNVFNMSNAVALDGDPMQFSYPGFDDLEKAGPQSLEGLKVAIDSVAAELARQL
jgi:hypothetical protein